MKVKINNDEVIEITGKSSDTYSEVEVKICKICTDALGITSIGIYDSIINLGADSLELMAISQTIEEEFRIEIPQEKITSDVSINTFTELIKNI